jgi:3-hydroxyisobutyrate dehydrogenase-like beta-hydroxyacid dehydrogenase
MMHDVFAVRMQGVTVADTVGVIGLGNMCSAFAANLLREGFVVVGYDVDAGRLDVFTAAGGRRRRAARDGHPGDPRETSGRTPAGAGGDRARLPVSGTGAQARTGDVAVYASGDRAAFERSLPALRGFSRAQHYVGEFGTGMRIKLIANLLVAIHNVAAAEAITLARRSGIDPDTLLEVISQGAGTSRMFEVRGPIMAAERWDESTANIEIFTKDLGLITEFAAAVDSPVPLLALSAQLYVAAMAQGRGRQDGAAVAGVLAGLAGLEGAAEPPR